MIGISFVDCSEYRNANESRRIGSGRIPLRDSWDDPKYSRSNANEFQSKTGGETASTSPTNASVPSTNKTEQNKPADASSNGNLFTLMVFDFRYKVAERNSPQIDVKSSTKVSRKLS